MEDRTLPVVIIGAGPVGMAAAVRLLDEGLTPLVLEAGSSVGASMLAWGHVQVFSPWQYNIDLAARARLEAAGWEAPDDDGYPTGREIVEGYLRPLAELPEIAPHITLNATVTAVARRGLDKMKSPAREEQPFVVRYFDANGDECDLLARAVIDASGTYNNPNPLGAGLPAIGEREARDRIAYGIPDVLDRDRAHYAGRNILVIGGGHSAFNVLLDLVRLKRQEPDTQITWAVRKRAGQVNYGGGDDDQLPARGQLGKRMQQQVGKGNVELVGDFQTTQLQLGDSGVLATSGDRQIGPFDEIIATTGFRPDLAILSELRVELDPATEAPPSLGPLIDPNIHSCGTVPPHGARELRHPESDFYIAGMKSYGRAPTFLMLTGYEQVRSIAAALAGDWERASRVELALPDTGVCCSSIGGCGADNQSALNEIGCCSTELIQIETLVRR